jgi:hypothetical protein
MWEVPVPDPDREIIGPDAKLVTDPAERCALVQLAYIDYCRQQGNRLADAPERSVGSRTSRGGVAQDEQYVEN